MKFSEFISLVPNGSIEYVDNSIVIKASKLLGKTVNWDTDIESVLFYCLHKLSKGANKRINLTYGFPIIENGELWVYSQVGFTVKLPASFNKPAETDNTSSDQTIVDLIELRQGMYPPIMFVPNLMYSMNLPGMEQIIVGTTTEDGLVLLNYGDTAQQIGIWIEGWEPPEDLITLAWFNTAPGIVSFTASGYPKYVKFVVNEEEFTTYKVDVVRNSLAVTRL